MFKIQNKEQVNPQTIAVLDLAIKKQQQILYIRTHNDQITSVCLDKESNIIVRQCSMNSVSEVVVKSDSFQKIECNIDYAFVEGGDAFLVYKNPFAIYYLTKQQQKPIKLILESQISYKNCFMQLNYPNIIISGCKQGEKKIQVSQFNLETLSSKIINDGKGYAPGPREEFISLVMDDRVYVFGGKDEKDNKCDKMIWVYDIEKGYWFALEMQYSDHDFSICQSVPISSSRALIYCRKTAQAWVLEIHQSRLTKVDGSFQYANRILNFKGDLINYNKKGWDLIKKKVSYHKL